MIEPLISIVIPTYNRQDTIESCLESIFVQTYPNYEVIIVDDGSSDNTVETVLAILRLKGVSPVITDLRVSNNVHTERAKATIQSHDCRISLDGLGVSCCNWLIMIQNNSGPAIARNSGIYASQGDYISFLDSDDFWYDQTLANFVKVIADNPGISFIAGTASEITQSPPHTLSDYSCAGDLKYSLYQNYYSASHDNLWIGTPSTCIRRSDLFEVGLFDSHRYNAEDSHLWLKLGTSGPFAFIRQPATFAYCRTSNSAVADHASTFKGLNYILLSDKMNRYPGSSKYQVCRSRIIAMHLKPSCLSLVKHHHYILAARLYSGALRHLVVTRDVLFVVCYPPLYIWSAISLLSRQLFKSFCFAAGLSKSSKLPTKSVESIL
jgi:glycosyltransferase involved in cell wall biosynthesis